jgi:hypothetical protein
MGLRPPGMKPAEIAAKKVDERLDALEQDEVTGALRASVQTVIDRVTKDMLATNVEVAKRTLNAVINSLSDDVRYQIVKGFVNIVRSAEAQAEARQRKYSRNMYVPFQGEDDAPIDFSDKIEKELRGTK